MYREGILSVTAADIASARSMGYVVKLLAICQLSPAVAAGDRTVSVRVHPAMIPRSHPLAAVGDAYNAVFVESMSAGRLMFYGPGAGGDFYEIAANGYVPALRLDDGTVLNEGASVLQYLADRKPEAGLAPAWGTIERYQLIDIQNYLATEVHKKLFQPIFSPQAPQAAKDAAKAELEPTLDYLAKRLGDRETLVGSGFTVADAYLVTLLNWFAFVGCDALAVLRDLLHRGPQRVEAPVADRAVDLAL